MPSRVLIEPDTSSVISRLVCTGLRSAQRTTHSGTGESSRTVTSMLALLLLWPSLTCTPSDSVSASSWPRTGWSSGACSVTL